MREKTDCAMLLRKTPTEATASCKHWLGLEIRVDDAGQSWMWLSCWHRASLCEELVFTLLLAGFGQSCSECLWHTDKLDELQLFLQVG